jgi:hypothetical protein
MTERNQPPAVTTEAREPKPGSAGPIGAGPGVQFSGDPAQVRAGFALALKLMGIDAPLPDVCEPDPTITCLLG